MNYYLHAGDNSGSLPVHDAAYAGKTECLKFLLKKGGMTASVDNKGRKILHKVL